MSEPSDFYEIFDLRADVPEQVKLAFTHCLGSIAEAMDRNARNYLNLDRELGEFLQFHVALDKNNEVLCCAGVQRREKVWGSWPRVMSRLYFSPRIRTQGMQLLFRPQVIHAKRMSAQIYYDLLSRQTEFCKKLEVPGIFQSVEYPRRRFMLTELTERTNIHLQSHWQMLEGMRLVCAAENSETCWQNVSFLQFQPKAALNLASISIDEWERRFSSERSRALEL